MSINIYIYAMNFEQFQKFHSDLTNYYRIPCDIYEDDIQIYFRMFRILNKINIFHREVIFQQQFKIWIVGYLYGRGNN
jgi:hypothetical protein